MYDRLIGTGGIGTGMLFQLQGNDTMGREESRRGALSAAQDACKGHIILHYVAQLTGCRPVLVGKVGDDAAGRALILDMAQSGIDTRFVAQVNNAPTMLSVCYQYEDHSGGNITASNSASEQVDQGYVESCLGGLAMDSHTVVLAAPEVPLEARLALLRAGRRAGALNCAAFLRAELLKIRGCDALGLVDVLAVNGDEARALLCGGGAEAGIELGRSLNSQLSHSWPGLRLIVTQGSDGVQLFDGGQERHIPAYRVRVANTGGAGDALLAGTISGLMRGLSLFDAGALGTAVAAMSVSALDTIARDISVQSVRAFLRANGGQALLERWKVCDGP